MPTLVDQEIIDEQLDECNDDGFPVGFMAGTAASMLDFVLMGGDLCKALGLEEDEHVDT